MRPPVLASAPDLAAPLAANASARLDVVHAEIADTIRVVRNPGSQFRHVCRREDAEVLARASGDPPSGAPRGIDDSSTTDGARIAAAGPASLAADSVVFTTSGEKPTAPSTVLQGDAIEPGGRGFGQGVRCVEGRSKRLRAKTANAGSNPAPQRADPRASVRSAALGSPILAGRRRWRTACDRDPKLLGSSPALRTFNGTGNGTGTIDVSWGP